MTRSRLFELVLVLAAFALRAYHLQVPGFEVDEAHSMRFVVMGYGGIINASLTIEPHPPLYYLLLRTWYLLAGPSEYALRLPALLPSVMAIPVIVRLGRRLGWPGAGLLAGALIAFNPYQLYYAQEARMYGLVLLVGALTAYLGVRFYATGARADAARYAAAGVLMLFVHYYGIFQVGFVGGFVLLALLLERAPREHVRRWLAAQASVAAALVGWLALSFRVALNFQRVEAHAATPADLWPTVLGALPEHSLGVSLPPQFDARGWVAFGVVALVGVGAAFARRGTLPRPLGGAFLALWMLAPVVGGFAVALVRDALYEPRYFMASAPALFLALGMGIVALWRVLPPIGLAGLLVVAGGQAASVAGYFDPNVYVRSEFPLGYAYVHAHLRPGDGIVLDCDDQIAQFQYEHTTKFGDPNPFYVLPGDARDPAALGARVDEIMAKHDGVWFLDFGRTACDGTKQVERALATRHYAALYQPLLRNRVAYYAADHGASRDVAAAGDCNGDLVLTGARAPAEPTARPGQLVPLALGWRVERATSRDYGLSWRLFDADGHLVFQRDGQPDAGFLPSAGWQSGQQVVDRYAMPLPVSMPPGRYRVEVGVYDRGSGAQCAWRGAKVGADGLLPFAELEVGGAPLPSIVEPTAAHAVGAGPVALKLVGYDGDAGPFQPGGAATLRLLWRAGARPDGDYALAADLKDPAGATVSHLDGKLGPDGYPTSRWEPGRLVTSFLDAPIPPRATTGGYTLALSLRGPAGPTPLATVLLPVVARERSFTAPPGAEPLARFGPIELLTAQPKAGAADGRPPGSALELALTWRAAGEVGTSYKVFTHLIGPDGKLHGQDDAIPQRGAAPTVGWMAGEVIADGYRLPLAADAPDGDYQVELGLYDPVSGARLPRSDGAGDSFVAARVRVAGGRVVEP